MTIFNARVDGARAEDGKVIFDVDVGGQKSAPWVYQELPQHGDLWGLNIHTSGEERDHIADAIAAYLLSNAETKRATFELARTQTILLSADSTCLRCARSSIRFNSKTRAQCGECGARYALAGSPAVHAARSATAALSSPDGS